MKFSFLLFVFLLLIFGCKPRFEGYTTSGEIDFRLTAFGENTLKLSGADHIKIAIASKKYSDEYFAYETVYNFQGLDAEYLGCPDLVELILGLVSGDSISIITPYSCVKEGLLDEYDVDGYKLADTTLMEFSIGIVNLLTENEYNEVQQELIHQGMLEENEFLEEYLVHKGIFEDCVRLEDAFMIRLDTNGNEKLKSGMEIALDYKGFYLDGSEFDSSTKSGDKLYFQIGKPDQVVRAIDLALRKMGEGESVRVYAPSHMTFGQKGSTTLIVPPLTPVYFEIRVDEVFVLPTDSISETL